MLRFLTSVGLVALLSASAFAVSYSQGFEDDADGWYDNVALGGSGLNGIDAKSGDYYGITNKNAGDFTRWGGYSTLFPTGGYTTQLSIYLDMNGGWANGTQFDYTSAISGPDNNHRRDFIFSVGFYNEGAMNQFSVTASNNSPGNPKDPARDPLQLTAEGWYTFQHKFYDNAGVLAVDLSVLDASGASLETWTLSTPLDIIGETVGGNRYGWFATNGFDFLAIDDARAFDNVQPTNGSVPEPVTMAGLFLGVAGLAGYVRRRRGA